MNLSNGTAFVAITYVFWGILTLFWGLLSEINSVYILSQRVFYSALFMLIFLTLTGKLSKSLSALKNRQTLFKCFICGILITSNWGIYIYAVTGGHVLDASLGYFLEPIIIAAFGMLFFKEKLSRFEKATFVFAIIGIAYRIVSTGTIPMLSILIALTFTVYSAVKKSLSLDAATSLFAETLLMSPFALIFTFYAEKTGIGINGALSGLSLLLIPACGVVTAIPLLLFNIGIKHIPFYVAGIIMYISPTIQFLTGILFFKETFNQNEFITFVIIWIGIGFTVFEKIKMLKASKNAKNIIEV